MSESHTLPERLREIREDAEQAPLIEPWKTILFLCDELARLTGELARLEASASEDVDESVRCEEIAYHRGVKDGKSEAEVEVARVTQGRDALIVRMGELEREANSRA